MGFEEIIAGLQKLGAEYVPDLNSVRLRWGDAADFFMQLTRIQQDYARDTLLRALLGKPVSWRLLISEVSNDVFLSMIFDKSSGQGRRRRSFWESFAPARPRPSVTWIEHQELIGHFQTALFRVAWQPSVPSQWLFSKGQPVLVRGVVSVIDVSWPRLTIILGNAQAEKTSNPLGSPVEINWLLQRDRKEHDSSLVGETHSQAQAQSGSFESQQNSALDQLTLKREYAVAGDASYQTAPLDRYSEPLRKLAETLFGLLIERAPRRGRRYKGSYSLIGSFTGETEAKIIIYETSLGKSNGPLLLTDGVYILLRANRKAEERFSNSSMFRNRFDRNRTMGIAPAHNERFTYFQVTANDDLKEIVSLLIG